MFCVAEENIVTISEAVIDSDLEAVGIVDCRPVLSEVVGDIAREREIRRRRIGPEKLLHRRKN